LQKIGGGRGGPRRGQGGRKSGSSSRDRGGKKKHERPETVGGQVSGPRGTNHGAGEKLKLKGEGKKHKFMGKIGPK